ncbi:MAG: VWA domain-containing protein [Chloroflexi bacterium]|nr:VWA domain-containing protein [Chloroflexota bacterium]
MIKSKDSEALAESEVDKLIAEIVSRTRTHPDIARGASVRGSLAFREVLNGLSEIDNGLRRESIGKAALITLPPRILGRQRGNEITIVSDIVQEVLYAIPFSRIKDESASPSVLNGLPANNIAEGLKLRPLTRGQGQKLTQKELSIIIGEAAQNHEIPNYLRSPKLLKKAEQNQHSFTRKQSKIPARELANTIMELMEVQDRQLDGEMNFERMYIYYHLKANSGRDELSTQKRDYDGLKTLIDELEKQGILRATETGSSFTLTAKALDTLLKSLTTRLPGGRGQPGGAIGFSRTFDSERQPEIRRYRSGDFFGDISVRHTLKEIARQKKDLSDIRRSDFRVFMKQPRKRQSDIVLCLDTSASMWEQHKLVYVRLAAAGLAGAAIENGDRVGVVTFNNSAQTTIPFTEKDKDAIISHLVKLSVRGNTNIGDGIRCASQLLFQEQNNNQKYILLITDGQPTAVSERKLERLKVGKGRDLTEESAILETRKAAARGVKVSAIHIANKDEASGRFISNIARDGRGKVRRLSRPEDLATIWRW